MIVDLPYAISVSAVPPGCTNRRYADAFAVAPFEIPEATSGTAPLSCGLRKRHRSFGGRSYVSAGMSLADFAARVRESRAPYMPFHRDLDTVEAVLNAAFRAPSVPASSPFGRPTRAAALGDMRNARDRLARGTPRPGVPKDVQDDSRQAAAMAAETWARALLVVDGEPWVAAPEPRYVACYEGGRAIRLMAMDRVHESARWQVGFRADRKAEAEAFCRAMAAGVRGRFFCEDGPGDIEVHDASALAFDEADATASYLVDGQDYWFSDGMRDALDARKRGDPSWAWAVLNRQDIDDKVARGPHRMLAKDRAERVEACRVALQAWRAVFARLLADPTTTPEAEEDAVLAMTP